MASFKQFFLFCNLFSESRKAAQKKALLFCSYQRYVQKAFFGSKTTYFRKIKLTSLGNISDI